MLHLIKHIIGLAVDKLVALITNDGHVLDITEEAARRLAERLTDRDLTRKVASQMDASSIAEEISVEDVAGHIDLYDIASNLDVEDVASHIDLNELADRVVDRLPERKDETPAQETAVDVSDPSLIERLLERAVDKLLARAEEAAKNGEL